MVALFESPKGTALRDVNNNYCTVDGQVSVGADFGSHYEHANFSDIVLIIPYSEIHLEKTNKVSFLLGVYNYKTNCYISFSSSYDIAL